MGVASELSYFEIKSNGKIYSYENKDIVAQFDNKDKKDIIEAIKTAKENTKDETIDDKMAKFPALKNLK